MLLIGVTETAHFCFPKEFVWTGIEASPFEKSETLDLFVAGTAVGELPERTIGELFS